MKALKSILAILILSIACTRPVLRVNGNPAVGLEARIARSDDLWKVSIDLPVGQWRARLRNDSELVQVESVGSTSVAWWRTSDDRMHQERPFILELRKEEGKDPDVIMELKIVRSGGVGQGILNGVLFVIYQSVDTLQEQGKLRQGY